jgi:hypothetical protein
MLFNRFLMGPLCEQAEAGGAGGAAAFTPEQLAAINEMVSKAANTAANNAIKGVKNEQKREVKTRDAQFDQVRDLVSGMKPKKAMKLLRKLGLELNPKPEEKPAAVGETPKPKPAEDPAAKPGDFFKKRQMTELEERIKGLEAENERSRNEAIEARKASQLDRVLSNLPWANMESRDLARDYYIGKLVWNEDKTELLIGEKSFDKHIIAEVPSKFENLLAPTGKGGSGNSKGQGKPGTVDIDAATSFGATPAQRAEASVALAALLPKQ